MPSGVNGDGELRARRRPSPDVDPWPDERRTFRAAFNPGDEGAGTANPSLLLRMTFSTRQRASTPDRGPGTRARFVHAGGGAPSTSSRVQKGQSFSMAPATGCTSNRFVLLEGVRM